MEYKLKTDQITVSEVVFDSFTELPIECDLLLPDYCPDIVKVLKCQAKPAFSKTEISGDKCILEGATAVSIYYTGEDGKLRTSEHKVEFSKSLELKAVPENPVIFCSAKEDYLNCKAVNQRRVDLRGAFTIPVKILSCHQEELLDAATGAGIQLSRRPMQTSELVGTMRKKFTVREDLELASDKPSIDYIVRHQEKARIDDCKVTGGKIIVKGELEVFIEYLTREDEGMETVTYHLPVSQMLDLNGAGDDCSCNIRFEMLWSTLHPQTDSDGETRAISGEFSLGVCCTVLRDKTIMPVTDAYSTQYEIQLSSKPSCVLLGISELPKTIQLSQSAQLPEYFKTPTDFWCETGAMAVSLQDENLLVSGKMRYCLLGEDADGAPVYFEQVGDVSQEYPLPAGAEGYLTDCGLQAENWGYDITGGNQLECHCDLKVEGSVLGVLPVNAINGIKIDETKEKKRENQSAMTIYYADEGENLWSIAKRYNTSITAVMEENGLEDEILTEKQIVLIPMIG